MSLFLLVSLAGTNVSEASDETFGVGFQAGLAAGRAAPRSGAFWGSFAAGLPPVLAGALLAPAVTAAFEPEIDFASPDLWGRSSSYVMAYSTAYRQEARRRRVAASIWGGLAGTATGLGVWTVINGLTVGVWMPGVE